MARESIKEAVAKEVEELRISFEMVLSDRRYPVKEFAAFAEAVRRYVEMTKDDTKIHKSVVNSVNGLREFIQLERKRVPGDIVFQADRLECLLFAGYDPSFEGDEPPGF
ncbi:MAG TPA: hypothetical protein VGG97_23360 [Bryobacteraceae bacterium]|jgi:hypothetical protein